MIAAHRRIFLGILFFLLTLSRISIAQDTARFSVGMGYGLSFGVNESSERPIGDAFEVSFLYLNGLGKLLTPQFGISTSSLSSGNVGGYSDYSTSVLSPELQLRLTPNGMDRWSPYFYLAFGLAIRSITARGSNDDPTIPDNGTDLAYGAGLGLFHRFARNYAFDIRLGSMITNADNLNPARDGKNDGWWQALITIHYVFDNTKESAPPPTEKIIDTDGDGLSDKDEKTIYGTDYLKKDTDGDGLTDYQEVMIYHTNPLVRDTDGDQLDDGDEVLKYHTDPLNVDTDGGGVYDGIEVRNGTNPLLKSDDLQKK